MNLCPKKGNLTCFALTAVIEVTPVHGIKVLLDAATPFMRLAGDIGVVTVEVLQNIVEIGIAIVTVITTKAATFAKVITYICPNIRH